MGVKINYARINRRVAAYIVDQMIFISFHSLFYVLILFISSGESIADVLHYVFSDTDTTLISERHKTLKDLGLLLENSLYLVLEVLMITKLGWTPGKLLCDIHIKDVNTLENISLVQTVVRSTLKVLLFVPCYISAWFIILPILTLIPAMFDKSKQVFYDKIAKTVVMDCHKPEESHLNINYVGITRRIIAYIIDCFIIIGVYLILSYFIKIAFYPDKPIPLTVTICLLISLSVVFGIFMVRKFSGTPGQLFCCICIKDANTLKNVTLMQATIRYVSFEIIHLSTIVLRTRFPIQYISVWWYGFLLDLIFTIVVITFISAIFDQYRQFLHDKIAKTVVIDHILYL